MRIALWLGLVTWLFEVSVLAFSEFALDRVRVWNLNAVWMGAAIYVLLFVGSGVLLHWPARGRPHGRAVAVGLLGAAAGASMALVFPRLHLAAALVLGIGIGARLASWNHSSGRFDRVVRASLMPILALAVVIVVAAASFVPLRERILRSRLPAPAAGAPDVLFVILDTVRAWNLGLHGYERPTTPEMERFAARGVAFDLALATSPYTLPSHYSAFSGLYPGAMTGILERDYDEVIPSSQPMLAEVLAGDGYATAAFVANLYYASTDFGFDRGFARYEDHPVSAGQFVLSTAPGRMISNNGRVRRLVDYHDVLNRKPAARVVDDFLAWRTGVRDRPWFAFLNLYDAHEPYLPPEPFEQRFVREPPRTGFFYDTDRVERLVTRNVSAEETRAQMDRYDGAIASMDAALGRLFDTLAQEGELDNTIVVITSDHGEAFMEHGRLGHVQDVFMSLIHVPLVVVAPGRVPVNLRVPAAVSIADLPATILELAGIPQPPLMPGESFTRFWNGNAAVPDRPVLAEANPGGNYKSVLDGRYHYFREPGGRPFLHDIVADPREQRNLAAMPGMQSEVRRLEALLDSLLTVTATPPYESVSLTERTATGAVDDPGHP